MRDPQRTTIRVVFALSIISALLADLQFWPRYLLRHPALQPLCYSGWRASQYILERG